MTCLNLSEASDPLLTRIQAENARIQAENEDLKKKNEDLEKQLADERAKVCVRGERGGWWRVRVFAQ